MHVTFSEPLIYKLWALILETKWAFASFKIFPWLYPLLTLRANESSKTFKFSQIHRIWGKSMIQEVQKTLFFNLSSFCLAFLCYRLQTFYSIHNSILYFVCIAGTQCALNTSEFTVLLLKTQARLWEWGGIRCWFFN